MEGLSGLVRMVNRSDAAVRAVLVNGKVAFEAGRVVPELGAERGFGTFLPALSSKAVRLRSGAARSVSAPLPP
jgi:hypothetical protein